MNTLRVLIALLMALPATIASANPIDHFGFGARALGMAGTGTAISDDFSANYYNPAALAAIDDLHIDLGYVFIEPFLDINGGDLDVDAVRGFQGGVVIPGELLGQRFGFSLGLYLPDERITRIRALPQTQPRWVTFDNRPQRIVITTSLGIQILEDLYIGAGLNFLANTKGTLEMEGLVHASEPERTQLFTGVDVSLESIRYPTFGLLWTPFDHWRIGVTYREEFFLDLALEVDVAGDVVFGPTNAVIVPEAAFDLLTTDTNLFTPRQLALGVAYEAEDWLVTVDLTWYQWSRFPSPTALIDITFDLPGLDFSLPPIDAPLDPGFRDILSPRVGGELTVIDSEFAALTLRAGYGYEPTPAPDQTGITNFVDNDKHTLGVGASLVLSNFSDVFPRPIYLDVAGFGLFIPERTYVKHDPADFIGDYKASGFLLGTSFSARLHF